MNELVFNKSKKFNFLGNTFINVDVIWRHETTNMIEIVNEIDLHSTTKIPIFDSNGIKVADIKGTRVYTTTYGKDAKINIEKQQQVWVCKFENNIIFEIQHQNPEFFKIQAELFAPSKNLISVRNDELSVNTFNQVFSKRIQITGNTFEDSALGITSFDKGTFNFG